MSFIYTPPPAAGSAVTPVLCQTITLAAIQGLIASSTLVCGRLYTITNPFQNSNGYGTVTVKATSTSTVDPTAVWNKPYNGVSIGGLLYDISMAPGNSIDTVVINSTNLLSAPVVYNGSLINTMVDVANNINLTAATSLRAIPTYSGIILVDTIVQTLYNGLIASSVTTGFPGPIQTYGLLYGEDPTITPIQLPIVYDINIGSLLSCYDYRTNNTISSFNNDTVVFQFPFNFSGIVNCTFNNTFFNNASIYAGFIDIDNCTFDNCTFFNILFNTLRIKDSTINNLQASAATDGIDFGISNCRILYPKAGPGQIFGSYITYPLLFVNVETDGRTYKCSGDVAFSGNPGSGALGSPVFMQTSPSRFTYKFTYRVQLFGVSIIGAPGASLEIGTNTNPSGLVNTSLSTNYNGVPNLIGNSFGPDSPGQFIVTPTVDNTNSGILTYIITGFTPL
jgi:hypothetical protein